MPIEPNVNPDSPMILGDTFPTYNEDTFRADAAAQEKVSGAAGEGAGAVGNAKGQAESTLKGAAGDALQGRLDRDGRRLDGDADKHAQVAGHLNTAAENIASAKNALNMLDDDYHAQKTQMQTQAVAEQWGPGELEMAQASLLTQAQSAAAGIRSQFEGAYEGVLSSLNSIATGGGEGSSAAPGSAVVPGVGGGPSAAGAGAGAGTGAAGGVGATGGAGAAGAAGGKQTVGNQMGQQFGSAATDFTAGMLSGVTGGGAGMPGSGMGTEGMGGMGTGGMGYGGMGYGGMGGMGAGGASGGLGNLGQIGRSIGTMVSNGVNAAAGDTNGENPSLSEMVENSNLPTEAKDVLSGAADDLTGDGGDSGESLEDRVKTAVDDVLGDDGAAPDVAGDDGGTASGDAAGETGTGDEPADDAAAEGDKPDEESAPDEGAPAEDARDSDAPAEGDQPADDAASSETEDQPADDAAAEDPAPDGDDGGDPAGKPADDGGLKMRPDDGGGNDAVTRLQHGVDGAIDGAADAAHGSVDGAADAARNAADTQVGVVHTGADGAVQADTVGLDGPHHLEATATHTSSADPTHLSSAAPAAGGAGVPAAAMAAPPMAGASTPAGAGGQPGYMPANTSSSAGEESTDTPRHRRSMLGHRKNGESLSSLDDPAGLPTGPHASAAFLELETEPAIAAHRALGLLRQQQIQHACVQPTAVAAFGDGDNIVCIAATAHGLAYIPPAASVPHRTMLLTEQALPETFRGQWAGHPDPAAKLAAYAAASAHGPLAALVTTDASSVDGAVTQSVDELSELITNGAVAPMDRPRADAATDRGVDVASAIRDCAQHTGVTSADQYVQRFTEATIVLGDAERIDEYRQAWRALLTADMLSTYETAGPESAAYALAEYAHA